METSRSIWARYSMAIVAVLAATVIRFSLDQWLVDSHEFTFYYAAVALVTWYGGPGPATLTLVAGMLLGDWFFLDPRRSLGPVHLHEWLTYGVFAITSGVIIFFSRASHLAYQRESLRAVRDLNQKLQEQADQLSESDRHKNEFLAMLGHELRNPLAGMLNGAQVLKMVGPDRPEAEEMRAVIERQAAHMTHLVDDLLDVSRISRGKIQLRRKRVDLVELVRAAVASHRNSIDGEGIGLDISLTEGPLWICADSTRIAQVVTNLLNNAVKFTDSGGRIEVSVTRETGGTAAAIAVRDTGIGMTPETLNRVFEPFSQADRSLGRSRGGLGLGLALVKGLTEMHGGEVTAHSDGIGRGATFRVRLPLSRSEAPAISEDPRNHASLKPHRILLIDDRRDAILPLQKMLELLRQEVVAAGDGKNGLRKVKEFLPEIILCDIGLPDIDGYAVARSIRNELGFDSVYLVAVTGYGQEEDRQRAILAGFDYHVTKPVGKELLERLLTDLPRFSNGAEDVEQPCDSQSLARQP